MWRDGIMALEQDRYKQEEKKTTSAATSASIIVNSVRSSLTTGFAYGVILAHKHKK